MLRLQFVSFRACVSYINVSCSSNARVWYQCIYTRGAADYPSHKLLVKGKMQCVASEGSDQKLCITAVIRRASGYYGIDVLIR